MKEINEDTQYGIAIIKQMNKYLCIEGNVDECDVHDLRIKLQSKKSACQHVLRRVVGCNAILETPLVTDREDDEKNQ